jgi:predicted DNA binding protein
VSVIVKLNFWSDDMVLADTFSSVPGVELPDYRSIAADPQRPHLFFWARVDDFSAFERAMADDPTVAEYECYGGRSYSSGTERFYRVDTSETTEVALYPGWVQSGADLIKGRFENGRWHCRARLPDRDNLERFRRFFDDNGIDLSIEAVYSGPEAEANSLTDRQRRALTLAAEMGYFDIPRQASLSDLADELDISEQAASERLRRAYRTLVEYHLA